VAFDPAILPFEFSDDTTLLEGGTPSSMPDALAFTKQVEAANDTIPQLISAYGKFG
jgi:hypothetical protein